MKILNNKGNISILLCISITVLFGFVAYVIDIGAIYAERIILSNAIDSAALAAVLELPKSRMKAMSIAEEYLQKNKVSLDEAVIWISDDDKNIGIQATRNVNHVFAVIFGVQQSEIEVSTKAMIAPVRSVTGGIRPVVVEQHNYTYGEFVTLKENAGNGYHGNYGAVVLGNPGAKIFKQNTLYGYKGKIEIGDVIDTQTGNVTSVLGYIQYYINSDPSTFNNYKRSSPRVWTIPMVDSLMVDGKSEVTVVGFAQFFVEHIGKQTGRMQIQGRFMRYVANGEIDITVSDTGVYGAKLVK